MLPGQICPMHHKQEGVRTCKMRNACTRSDAALISLAGSLAPIPDRLPAEHVFDSSTFITPFVSSAILRAPVPESPPPRA